MSLITRNSGKRQNHFCFTKLPLPENIIGRKRRDNFKDESKVANAFSYFFENAVHSLGIKLTNTQIITTF